MQDLFNNIHSVEALAPQSSADDTALVGAVVDLLGHDSCTIVISIGSIGDADATFAVLLEDSDTGAFAGEQAAVPDAGLLGTEVLAGFQFDDDNETRKLGYINGKRYVRLTITPANNSGTPSAALLGAVAVLGHAGSKPSANPPQA
jgi:hypothetical protein